jgi:hypothetical protein
LTFLLILATFKNRQHLQNQQQQYEATTSTTSSSTSLGLCQEIYYHDPTFSEGESILEVTEKVVRFQSSDYFPFSRLYKVLLLLLVVMENYSLHRKLWNNILVFIKYISFDRFSP